MDAATACYHAGWHAACLDDQLQSIQYTDAHTFVPQYLRGLHPEVITMMKKHAHELLSPPTASLVKQFQTE